MERNRENRRASVVSSNGFNRRRFRTNGLRDSPDEDVGVEMQHESARLRERAKKDRDRERDRERDLRDRDLRERDSRERDLRERPNRVMHSVKRRRNERLTSEETSEESVNDEEDDEDEDNNSAAAAGSHHHGHRDNSSSGFSRNINNNPNNITNISSNNNLLASTAATHRLEHGKSYPPPNATSKAFRAPPPVWRSGDEVINVSVPRKARSSTKRSHDWISSSSNNNSGGGGGGGEQILRQVSDSAARHGGVSTPNQPPTSPSSSNASMKKKLKHAGGNNNLGPKPSKPSKHTNPEELEFEIAEVLFGMKIQGQGTSSSSGKKDDASRSNGEAKASNSASNNITVSGPNRSPLTAVVPKRKKPRQVPENLSHGLLQIGSVITAKEADRTEKFEILSTSNVDKVLPEMEGSTVISQAEAAHPPEPTAPLLGTDSSNLLPEEEVVAPKEKESAAVITEGVENEASTSIPTSKAVEAHKEGGKFEIDLMAPPPQQRPSPERETVLDSSHVAADPNPVSSSVNMELIPPVVISKENDEDNNEKIQEKKRKESESSSVKAGENNGLGIDFKLNPEKPERGESDGGANPVGNKLPNVSAKAVREDQSPAERHGQTTTNSMLLPLPVPSWPGGGFPPIGYVAAPALQGVVSTDGAAVTPTPLPPLFSQPRTKRCATHCQIARNIYYHQQFAKMSPFWPAGAAAGSPLFGPGPRPPSNPNLMPGPDLGTKGHDIKPPVNNGLKISPSQASNASDSSSQRKQQQQQVMIQQQALPPHVAPNNLMGPTFIFPLNQQQAKQATTAPLAAANVSSAQTVQMPFGYPNEPQYLAILQNGGYPFPMPPGFRGPAGHPVQVFNGSFFPSPMVHHHPQQLQQPNSLPQNANASNGSSSSQKQQQQQKTPQSAAANVSFASSQKNNQQSSNGDESSSRLPPAVNMYGQNLIMHPQNFAFMAPSTAAAYGGSNQTEKRATQHHHQQQQQQGAVVKTGAESLAPHHGFAMSFSPGIDMSSMAQSSHSPMFQGSQDMTRQMKKNAARVSEDGKSSSGGGDVEDERKAKSQGQSIAFARSDFADGSRGPRAPSNAAHGLQSQIQQQQQQQILHMKHQHQQQQIAAAANRGGSSSSKGPVGGTGSPFADLAKFPMVPMMMSSSSNSPVQPQSQPGQWKGSAAARASAPPPPPPQAAAAAVQQPSRGGVLQQNSRAQPPAMHHNTQISFGGSHKPSTAVTAAAAANSPTTSSMSKGNNSPRTSLSASTTNSKMSQGSPKSSQSSMLQTQKSTSILGNPQLNSSSNPGAKAAAAAAQAQAAAAHQQQQQQMMAKNMQQHAQQQQQQFFFSNPFVQVHSSSSSPSGNASPGAGVYFVSHQQKRPEKSHHHHQQQVTTDPAKAIAAATGGGTGGASPLPPQGVFGGAQFGGGASTLLTGFPYPQPGGGAGGGGLQASKPSSEQKQQPAAGNENPRTWQPEKK